MNTIGYSSPLALWSVISVTRPSSSARVVGVGDQRDLLQELPERAVLGVRRVVLGGDVDELLEVLDPPLGLDRALGLERLQVAGLREQSPGAASAIGASDSARSRSTCIVPMNRRSALIAAAPEARAPARASAAASQIGLPIVFANASTRDIDVAPIPRRGELTIRVNAPTSCGLTSTVRYAIASLISARS